jgi:YegS/Rv2252/BmrU family lipid kinase
LNPPSINFQPKRVRFLINPKSGIYSAGKTIKYIKGAFPAPEWEIDFKMLQLPEQGRSLAAQAVEKGYWAVVVAGGDGTIHEAVQGLAGSDIFLGILPLGTGNGLARGLGIPLNLKKACEVVKAGRVKGVDLALINGLRYFINICGVGFDACVAKTANDFRALGRLGGLFRYLAAGLVSLRRFRPRRLKIRYDGENLESDVLVIAVCNNGQYGFGKLICPAADPCDRQLNLVVIPPLSLPRFALNLWRLLNSRKMKGVHYLEGLDEILIERDPLANVHFHADGEPAGDLPLHIRLSSSQVMVLVP